MQNKHKLSASEDAAEPRLNRPVIELQYFTGDRAQQCGLISTTCDIAQIAVARSEHATAVPYLKTRRIRLAP
jgi:hypothetical protein